MNSVASGSIDHYWQWSIFWSILASFDEKKVTEAKTDRKTGQHPADDRDSDDEMEANTEKKKPIFKNIVNEIS